MSNEQLYLNPIEFDSELILSQILSQRLMKQIDSVIKQFGIGSILIVNMKNTPLFGDLSLEQVKTRLPIAPELEPIGYLCFGDIEATLAKGILRFVVMMVQSEWRYHMASDMHIKAIKADFEALKEKHALLQQSENRYRELSQSLEIKVKEQVEHIESTRRKLYEAEKLASVGQLAAGVAHEINNPIGFINSNLRSAVDYISDISEWAKPLLNQYQNQDVQDVLEDFVPLINECLIGGERIRSIVADLKAFSDIDHTELCTIKIKDAIERVVRIFQTQNHKNINFSIKVDDEISLLCRAGFINQLILNLLTNSGDAIDNKGTILIEGSKSENLLKLKFTDSGKGMSEEALKRAFEPFFTTKDVGGGTGLGLTVARDIANNHQGDIEILETSNEGTKILVTLRDIT